MITRSDPPPAIRDRWVAGGRLALHLFNPRFTARQHANKRARVGLGRRRLQHLLLSCLEGSPRGGAEVRDTGTAAEPLPQGRARLSVSCEAPPELQAF